MRKSIWTMGLVAALGLSGAARADEAPWRGDGVTDGVQVERRDVKGSHFDELRLSLLSTVSVERL